MADFNRLTVLIFGRLLEDFPKPSSLTVDGFQDSNNHVELQIFRETIIFLQDNDFLEFRTATGTGSYHGVKLTLKTLNILNQTPDALRPSPTVREKLVSAIKIGTKEAFKETVKVIVGEAIKSFSK